MGDDCSKTPEEFVDPAQEAARIWKDINEHPGLAFPAAGTPSWSNLAMVNPVLLFGQALKAFQAGADAGTALLCRSALEAALYVFLTRRKMEGTAVAYWIDTPLRLDGKLREVKFEELRRGITKRKVLSSSQREAISRIQRQGNIIAHLVSRSDKEIFRPHEPQELGKALRLWVTRQQALEDVRDTAEILKTLADSMAQA